MSKIGNTIVNGNLNIQGSNTEFNSDAIKIKDNIITLNSKETSNKISNGKAGIEIERGSSTNYQLVYDETDSELKAGLSNNLKPLVSKEYSDNNIANTQTNLNEQIYQNDYINVLPKIGYYQDDTVEVVSKYNCNNPTSYGQLSNPVCTVDTLGRTILYFMANDGSYDTDGKYQLYYGYREGNSTMTFVNEPLIIQDAPNNYIEGIVSCDNDWIVLKFNGRYYIYDTNYSVNPDKWTNRKDITSIIKSTWCIGFKFMRKYNTIAIAYLNNRSYTAENCGILEIYRYSDLKLLQSYPLENFAKYAITPGRYLDSNKQHSRLSDSGNMTSSYETWHNSSFIIYDNEELIVFTNCGVSFNYYGANSNTISSNQAGYIHIAYNVPKSIFMGNTGTITTLTKDHDLFIRSPMVTLFNQFGNCSYYVVSYNSLDNITYLCGCKRDVFVYGVCEMDNTLQKNVPSTEYLGIYQGKWIGVNISWPSDASVWGKQIKKGFNMWDVFVLDGRSKQYNNGAQKWFNVKQWQKYKGQSNTNIIEPKPGGYSVNTNIQSSPYYAQLFNGFTTNRMNDGSATYYACANYNNSTGYVGLYKYIRDSDSSKDDEAFATHHKLIKNVNIGTINEWNKLLFKGQATNLYMNGIYYNPIGDYFIIFCKDRTTYIDSNTPNFAQTMCLGVIKNNGEKIAFDIDKQNQYGALKGLNDSLCNWRISYNTNLNEKTWTCIDKYTILICIEWSLSNNSYGAYTVKLHFNDDTYSSFTITSTGNSGMYSYSDNIDRPINIYYSGPKYGLMCSGNGWARSPMMFKTQYPIFNGEGKQYTDDEFISNPGANANTYYMYLQSSQGLIAYVPSIPIFLGGYFEVIQNPIAVNLQPNTNNYIYLERDSSTKELKAYASTTKDIEEGSKQFSRILLARILTNEANPIETEYYRINTGYNDYTFYHKIIIKQTPNQTIHVYTTENGQRVDHTTSFFVKINSNIQYSIEIKPDLWYVAGTLQNISSSGIINQNIIVSATTANLISTNYSYDFKIEYATSTNTNDTYAKIKYPLYCFGNNISSTWPSGQNYSGSLTPIDNIAINTVYDSAIQYQHTKPLPDEIKSVFIKLVCKDGEHYLGHFTRNEFDQYGDIYHSKILGTKDNFDLFKRLYDSQEVFTCVVGVET